MRAAAIAFMVLATVVGTAVADDDYAPRTVVRAHLEPDGPVAVGATVRLVVDALVTTWFTEGLELPPLEVPGAVVAPSDESPPHLSESIEGTTFFGVSRVYLVTPTAPGALTIPPITLTLHPGQGPGPVEASTPPLTLTVVALEPPPGAEHALPATKLTLTQFLDRKLDGIRVGDSLTRTITARADGVRGMFLPPVAFPPTAGLGVYPAPPQVEDVTDDHGGFTGGTRIDAATYVVQAPGRYVLPAITITWWDPRAQAVQTASAPPVAFEAAAAPATRPELALPTDDAESSLTRLWSRWNRAALAAIVLAIAGGAAWLLAPTLVAEVHRLAAARAERRRRHEASEDWAFERVTESVRTGDPAATYVALQRWLQRLGTPDDPVTVESLGTVAADPVLARDLAALAATLYGNDASSSSWNARELSQRLPVARRHVKHPSGKGTAHAPLPPLNP
jgi:hypothetical protein